MATDPIDDVRGDLPDHDPVVIEGMRALAELSKIEKQSLEFRRTKEGRGQLCTRAFSSYSASH